MGMFKFLNTCIIIFCGAIALTACGGHDDRETWITAASATYPVPGSNEGSFTDGYFGLETQVSIALMSRHITPIESLCGVVADYDPLTIITIGAPDRVYHFRVTDAEARALVSTGIFIYRDQYDPNLAFTQVPCDTYGLRITG